MKKLVYVGHYNGTSKKTGKPFHQATFIDLENVNRFDGRIEPKVIPMFLNSAIAELDTLKCGALIECEFTTTSLENPPTLTRVNKVIMQSPYFDKVKPA